MRRVSIVLIAVLVTLQFCCSLWAKPMTADQAEKAVTGWLTIDSQPLGTLLSRQITNVDTFTDDYGRPAYYIVYLQPSGFVVVSADDLVEPIIGFADDGIFEPSLDNPLGALVINDLKGRITKARNTFRLQAVIEQASQNKWEQLINLAQTAEDGFSLKGLVSISDVRVDPLIKSKWGQHQICGQNCFNYYTPNNYYCGCTATAIAQLMRYHEYPATSTRIGRHQCKIMVDDIEEYAYTRGGDSNGGPYQWPLMVFEPGCSTTPEQRQAIGTLCYDAGIAAQTEFSDNGSASTLLDATNALLDIFNYSNAVRASDELGNMTGDWLNNMVNTNLDASYPVILGIRNTEYEIGHAVIADGYGYNFSSLYHHLNMGWDGSEDIWYNLPDVHLTQYDFYNIVTGCLYNIFTSGSGEIISGRVTDTSGNPLSDATITAQSSDNLYTTVTNDRGIYAFVKVSSYSTYTIRATKSGYSFAPQRVVVQKSENSRYTTGNKWGVDFTAEDPSASPTVSESYKEDFETGDFSRFSWEHAGDNTWLITPLEKFSGNYSAEAGQISDNQNVALKISMDCIDGDIAFCHKISSEPNFDFLKFYIDGTEEGCWSGTKDWTTVSRPVSAGERTFEWTYSKDDFMSEGFDTAWIDDIIFPLDCNQMDPPVILDEPETTPGLNNTILWNPVSGADRYFIECADDEHFTDIIADSGWTKQTSYTFTELNHDRTYWYRVKCKPVTTWSQTNQIEIQNDALTNTVISPDINLPGEDDWDWDTVQFNSTIPLGTELTIDVFDVLDDSELLAGVISGADISDINVPSIRLQANLSSESPEITPILHNWSVAYTRASCESDWSQAEFSLQCGTLCD